MSTKMGQSLIEVIAALSIVAIVFAGTITLVVQAVNLQFLARDKAEAVIIAQGEISKAVEGIRAGCSQVDYIIEQEPAANERYTYDVEAIIEGDSFDFFDEEGRDIGLNGDNFLKITVRVSWKNKRGLEQEYETFRLVRKE